MTATKITVKGPMKHIILAAIYRPPGTPVSWFNELEALILELTAMGPLIILGDLNADLLKPNLGVTKLLKKALAMGGLKVPSTTPTRICATAATCLDVIALPKDIDCSEYSVVPKAASDHYLIEATLDVAAAAKPQPIIKRSFKRVNPDELRMRASQIQLDSSEAATPDSMLDEWNKSIIEVLDELAPLKAYPVCRKKCEWLSTEVRGLMLLRDSMARKISIDPNPTEELLEQARKLRRKVTSRMRRASREYGLSVFNSGQASKSWEFIRATTLSTTRGERTSMDVNELNESFAKNVTASSGLELAMNQSCDKENVLLFEPLGNERVRRMLTTMKTRTATGPDGISASLLQMLAPAVAPNLTAIMNKSMAHGVFPTMWKKANVAAVWKGKGSKTDAGNYRPISVLPVLARLFEKVVAAQLVKHCDTHNIIPAEQFGFRSKSSCEMALITATDEWMRQVDEGQVVGSLLIDLSKAFDTVPHQQLLGDLHEIGCGQTVSRWFHSYLEGREQRVIKGLEVTEWKKVSRGVPQGSCLSPLLFNVFVRELPAASTSQTVQFADDVTQSEADKDVNLVLNRLTESLSKTKAYCDRRELIINASKTQLIVFKSPRRKLPEDLKITIDGVSIEPVPHVKLLGVHLDQHFTYGEHMDKIVKKCNGVLGMLTKAAPYMPRELLRTAYVALVRSNLEYASSAFMSASKTQLKKIDTVQKIASRIICRVPRDTHSEPLLKDLELESLESRRNTHAVQLIDAILAGNSHPSLARLFTRGDDGGAVNSHTARTGMGRKRFSIHAKNIYNQSRMLSLG